MAHSSYEVRNLICVEVLITDPIRQSADDQWRVASDVTFGRKSPALLQVYPIMLLGDFGLSAPLKDAHTFGIGSVDYIAPVRLYMPWMEVLDRIINNMA
jgi:hypothetical protein